MLLWHTPSVIFFVIVMVVIVVILSVVLIIPVGLESAVHGGCTSVGVVGSTAF